MDTCTNPFLIWFTGRTGSTYLCDLLNSHPQITCRKEQFVEVKLEDDTDFPANGRTFTSKAGEFGRRLFADQKVIDDPADEFTLGYLSSVLNGPTKACGFKLKFPNQSLVYPEIVSALQRVDNLRVIELIRDNVLRHGFVYYRLEICLRVGGHWVSFRIMWHSLQNPALDYFC